MVEGGPGDTRTHTFITGHRAQHIDGLAGTAGGNAQKLKISTFGTSRVSHLAHIGPKVGPRICELLRSGVFIL